VVDCHCRPADGIAAGLAQRLEQGHYIRSFLNYGFDTRDLERLDLFVDEWLHAHASFPPAVLAPGPGDTMIST
jgi:hypothetical protein